MLHHVQTHILDTLAMVESAPYSQLKPADMDGNSFTYHLKQLLSSKYIGRNEDGSYALTQRGKTHIVHRYEDASHQAHAIFLVVIKIGDQYLLRERLVQPLLGYAGFIHGEPQYDEPIVTTAERRVYEKTGLNISLSVRSSGLVAINRSGELQSYSHVVVLYGEASGEQSFTPADETGRNFTASRVNLHAVQPLPSCQDILDSIDRGQTWFEYFYDI